MRFTRGVFYEQVRGASRAYVIGKVAITRNSPGSSKISGLSAPSRGCHPIATGSNRKARVSRRNCAISSLPSSSAMSSAVLPPASPPPLRVVPRQRRCSG